MACTDGGGDNGLDYVYISPTNVIWLVQTKYIHEGSGEPSLADAGLFRDGVNDVFAGDFVRCKTLSTDMIARLRKVLSEEHQVVFALVYTGTSMDESRRTMFGEVEKRVNRIAPGRARFVRFGLSDFHAALTQQFAEPEINGVQIDLHNYGVFTGTARAYYGTMRAKDLAALYRDKGHPLVRANIRRYRGSTVVNSAISSTLKSHSDKFFFFNNGITFLCRSIRPAGLPKDNLLSTFHLDGVSIINGAQTAGTLAQEEPAHYDAHPADILVTCIQLPADDHNFADEVTRFRNSQNAVLPQDFAALDDNQEAWRRTLESEGITYVVKHSSDDLLPSPTLFGLSEAAESRALAHPPLLGLLISEPDRLWDTSNNIQGQLAGSGPSVYKSLFPDSLSARQLWRTLQMARFVRQTIVQEVDSHEGRDADIAKCSIRLMTHIVMLICKSVTDGATLALEHQEVQLLSATLDKARSTLQALLEVMPDTKERSAVEIFSDMSTLTELKGGVMQALQN